MDPDGTRPRWVALLATAAPVLLACVFVAVWSPGRASPPPASADGTLTANLHPRGSR